MNIFAVSKHPRSCARALDDKRLNKMILETAQILCAVLNGRGFTTPYRSSHVNHPITKWAASDDDHLKWLYHLGIAYGQEIIYRHSRKHSCHLVLEGLTFQAPWLSEKIDVEDIQLHNGARHKGLGLDFTHLPVHEAYRTYLSARWPNDKRAPTWTRRRPPSWYQSSSLGA